MTEEQKKTIIAYQSLSRHHAHNARWYRDEYEIGTGLRLSTKEAKHEAIKLQRFSAYYSDQATQSNCAISGYD